MRVLLAGLASPGFIMPVFACARDLRDRGHEVAVVTGESFGEMLARAGVARVPRGRNDGPSFAIHNWWDADALAVQVLHLEYAIRTFRPDVIVASYNCLGPLVTAALHGIPLLTIGSLVALLPTASELAVPCATAIDARRRYRLETMIGYLNDVRRRFELRPVDAHDVDALTGDRQVVQGLAEFQPDRRFAEDCVFVGGGLFHRAPEALPGEDREWLERQRSRGRRVVYAAVGRLFDHRSFVDALFAWARRRDAALIVDGSRCEDAIAEASDSVRRCDGLDHNDLLPYVDGVVCSGHPAGVIGAINHRRPLAICYTGSGTDDIGEACSRFGLAASLDTDPATIEEFAAAFDRLVDDPRLREMSAAAAGAFEGLDARALVAESLTELGAGRLCAT